MFEYGNVEDAKEIMYVKVSVVHVQMIAMEIFDSVLDERPDLRTKYPLRAKGYLALPSLYIIGMSHSLVRHRIKQVGECPDYIHLLQI